MTAFTQSARHRTLSPLDAILTDSCQKSSTKSHNITTYLLSKLFGIYTFQARSPLSPLVAIDTNSVSVSPLFATDTKTKDLKSFVCNLMQEQVGEGGTFSEAL